MLCSTADAVSCSSCPILFKVLTLNVAICIVCLHFSNFCCSWFFKYWCQGSNLSRTRPFFTCMKSNTVFTCGLSVDHGYLLMAVFILIQAKAGWPARTYIQQLCEDTGCSPEDLPEAMKDREEWQERVRDIRDGSTTWWWWYIYIYIYINFFMYNAINHWSTVKSRPKTIKINIIHKITFQLVLFNKLLFVLFGGGDIFLRLRPRLKMKVLKYK